MLIRQYDLSKAANVTCVAIHSMVRRGKLEKVKLDNGTALIRITGQTPKRYREAAKNSEDYSKYRVSKELSELLNISLQTISAKKYCFRRGDRLFWVPPTEWLELEKQGYIAFAIQTKEDKALADKIIKFHDFEIGFYK